MWFTLVSWSSSLWWKVLWNPGLGSRLKGTCSSPSVEVLLTGRNGTVAAGLGEHSSQAPLSLSELRLRGSFAVFRDTSFAGSSDLQLIKVRLEMLTGQVSGMVFFVELHWKDFSEVLWGGPCFPAPQGGFALLVSHEDSQVGGKHMNNVVIWEGVGHCSLHMWHEGGKKRQTLWHSALYFIEEVNLKAYRFWMPNIGKGLGSSNCEWRCSVPGLLESWWVVIYDQRLIVFK